MSVDVAIPGVIFASLTAPTLLNFLNNRTRAKEKAEEWARQDRKDAEMKEERAADLERQNAVAVQAAEAARLLAESQARISKQAAEAAALLIKSNAQVANVAATAAAKTDGQLKVIHGLVNSTLTAAKEGELTASELALFNLNDNIRLRQRAGEEPTTEVLAARDALQTRTSELRAEVADRHQKGLIAAAQIRNDPTDPTAAKNPQ